jgi:2-isopropylmalate synthase
MIVHKFRGKLDRESVISEMVAAVRAARDGGAETIGVNAEDGSRTDEGFLLEFATAARDAGADRVRYCDTIGGETPDRIRERFAKLAAAVRIPVETHCHNDLGMAVANSVSGALGDLDAGQDAWVNTCVNGIGERAGNAALEEIVMALGTRPDFFGDLTTGVRTEELAKTSRLVSRLTGYPVQYNKAVVGRNAFAHESGIHQHGVLVERSTYEIMDPSTVGQGESQIVLGKHSGRHAFADTLAKMGITIQGDALNQAFVRFKELADRKVQITDADLEAIVAEELGGGGTRVYELASLDLHGGTIGEPSATVVLTREGVKHEAAARGDGMIDAACQAIRSATGVDATLMDFAVNSVTGGVDALGDVVVQAEYRGRKVTGRGVSTDVVEASARAYLNAINKLVRLEGVEEKAPESTP